MARTQSVSAQQSDDRSVSEAVLDAVAQETGTDPLEFERLLSDAVDPDALDRLFRNTATRGRIEFRYAECDVAVESDGSVDVTARSDQ